FPGNEDITQSTLHEGIGRATGTRVKYRPVGEQLAHELVGLLLITAVLLHGITPGGQVVPAGTAGGFRVGGDDFHVVTDQIIPVLDVLRVAVAHQQHDGGRVGRDVVCQAALPVLRDQVGVLT